MEPHDRDELDGTGRAHSRSREVHAASLIDGTQGPRLSMVEGDEMFSVAL